MSEEEKNSPKIGIGILGYGTMGRVFSNGFMNASQVFWPLPAQPELVKICGRNKELVSSTADRLGFPEYCTDWEDLVNDDRIDLILNCGPNNIHAEPCIAAAKNKKHILCEKPLGMNAGEARAMLDSVEKAEVYNICNYIYRTVPAIVKLKEMISEGVFGKINIFRGIFLTDFSADPEKPVIWRNRKEIAGYGVSGDLSSHIIDLARFLVGDIDNVIASNNTITQSRPVEKGSSERYEIELEDCSRAILEFKDGAFGTIESCGVCFGHGATAKFEINGELGSAWWSFDNINYLNIFLKNDKNNTKGFKAVKITDDDHPYYKKWPDFSYTTGISYINLFTHMAYSLICLVKDGREPYPGLATFKDGYMANLICDSIQESSESGKRIIIEEL